MVDDEKVGNISITVEVTGKTAILTAMLFLKRWKRMGDGEVDIYEIWQEGGLHPLLFQNLWLRKFTVCNTNLRL